MSDCLSVPTNVLNTDLIFDNATITGTREFPLLQPLIRISTFGNISFNNILVLTYTGPISAVPIISIEVVGFCKLAVADGRIKYYNVSNFLVSGINQPPGTSINFVFNFIPKGDVGLR